jgi:hypothetical protein
MQMEDLTSNNHPRDGFQHMSTKKYVATAKKTTQYYQTLKAVAVKGIFETHN